MARGSKELSHYSEGSRPELISPRKLLPRKGDIDSSVAKSIRAANELLEVFGYQVELPKVTFQTIIDFAHFLDQHGFEAMGVSTVARLMATAKSPEQRGEIRRQFMKMLDGEPQKGLRNLIPWSPECQLSGLAILRQDGHFTQHYLPTFAMLDELASQTESQLLEAEKAREQALTNQGLITRSFLGSAKRARVANSQAQQQRVTLDSLVDKLTQKISGHVDVVQDIDIDGLIRQTDRVSRVESDARVKEAKARSRACVSLASFIPAVASRGTLTTREVALHLISQMVDTTLLFVLGCYEDDIAVAMEDASKQAGDAFRLFIQQAAERRKQLAARIQGMRNTLKIIPAETETN